MRQGWMGLLVLASAWGPAAADVVFDPADMTEIPLRGMNIGDGLFACGFMPDGAPMVVSAHSWATFGDSSCHGEAREHRFYRLKPSEQKLRKFAINRGYIINGSSCPGTRWHSAENVWCTANGSVWMTRWRHEGSSGSSSVYRSASYKRALRIGNGTGFDIRSNEYGGIAAWPGSSWSRTDRNTLHFLEGSDPVVLDRQYAWQESGSSASQFSCTILGLDEDYGVRLVVEGNDGGLSARMGSAEPTSLATFADGRLRIPIAARHRDGVFDVLYAMDGALLSWDSASLEETPVDSPAAGAALADIYFSAADGDGWFHSASVGIFSCSPTGTWQHLSASGPSGPFSTIEDLRFNPSPSDRAQAVAQGTLAGSPAGTPAGLFHCRFEGGEWRAAAVPGVAGEIVMAETRWPPGGSPEVLFCTSSKLYLAKGRVVPDRRGP